jgi:hypothetical protein
MSIIKNEAVIETAIIIILFLLMINTGFLIAQDSLEYQYSIVGMEFYADHDVIKIKVPPWLKTSEVISQIKAVLFWPDRPAPEKTTYVYVFKETDQIGETSNTGAVFFPDKGFLWSLSDWSPAKIPEQTPSEKDLYIYYSLTDRIIEQGSSFSNIEVKKEIARQYHISTSTVDSIYTFVKYWLSSKQQTPLPGEGFIEPKKKREKNSPSQD